MPLGESSVPSKCQVFTAFKSGQLDLAQINPFVNPYPWSLQPIYIWVSLVMLSVSAWGEKNKTGGNVEGMVHGALLLDFQACGGPEQTMAVKRMLATWRYGHIYFRYT